MAIAVVRSNSLYAEGVVTAATGSGRASSQALPCTTDSIGRRGKRLLLLFVPQDARSRESAANIHWSMAMIDAIYRPWGLQCDTAVLHMIVV